MATWSVTLTRVRKAVYDPASLTVTLYREPAADFHNVYSASRSTAESPMA